MLPTAPTDRPSLHGMLPEDLHAYLEACGAPSTLTDARRVLAHVLSDGHDDLSTKRQLPRRTREAVDALTTRTLPEVVERHGGAVGEDVGPDEASERVLLRFADGRLAEFVRIPLLKRGCFTICLSSQVGCAMKCDFCATGRLGLGRNLSAAEMVGSFLVARAHAQAVGGRVTGVVFMGQGEPFHNYEAVIQAARILGDPCGTRIDAAAISISTVGLVPQIRRYTAEGHKFRLVVSLTSAVPEKRARLVPVAGRTPLVELADALRAHQRARGGLQTVAWVLMGGVNHGPDEVEALRDFLGDLPARLNLIDVNDVRPGGYRRATDAERKAFVDALQILHIPIVRRYSVGKDDHAACGMLAARHVPATPDSVVG